MRKAHQSTENDKIEIRMRAPARRAFVSPVWLTAVLLLGAAGAESRRCPRPCICDHIQLTVSCLKRNLTEVPPTLPEVTKKLDLRGNDIRELRTGGFLRTPYLTHLTLQRCNIETVQEGAFRGLGRLLFLSLADNRISILYQESFDGLSSLKQLLVDRNRVEELQPGAFAQLGFLNLLSLAENFLVYLPDVVFQGLRSLRWLRLSHNALNTLGQEAFAGLLALQRLSLDHNELQFFPTEPLTRLPELTRLDLGWNPMTYLGEEAVAVPRLRQLFLDHMSLQDVSPAALQRAPALALLDLSHNQLRALQPLGGPERLGRLNLTGNPVLCSCSLRPLREWADRRRARLAGACAGPPHLAGEGLDAVEPGQLRCVSREALERAEREERLLGATPRPVPDTAPARCPAGCECQGQLPGPGRGGVPAPAALRDPRAGGRRPGGPAEPGVPLPVGERAVRAGPRRAPGAAPARLPAPGAQPPGRPARRRPRRPAPPALAAPAAQRHRAPGRGGAGGRRGPAGAVPRGQRPGGPAPRRAEARPRPGDPPPGGQPAGGGADRRPPPRPQPGRAPPLRKPHSLGGAGRLPAIGWQPEAPAPGQHGAGEAVPGRPAGPGLGAAQSVAGGEPAGGAAQPGQPDGPGGHQPGRQPADVRLPTAAPAQVDREGEPEGAGQLWEPPRNPGPAGEGRPRLQELPWGGAPPPEPQERAGAQTAGHQINQGPQAQASTRQGAKAVPRTLGSCPQNCRQEKGSSAVVLEVHHQRALCCPTCRNGL